VVETNAPEGHSRANAKSRLYIAQLNPPLTAMPYIATLTGEFDAHVEQRKFGTQASAIAWCEGEGL
jgi:hypothetical protein